MLNCVNTIICHRLNDAESAETVSLWAGTKEAFDVTAQLDMNKGSTGMGSIKRNQVFVVHPDDIKQSLKTGEVFYMSKAAGFTIDKVKVKYS